MAAKKREGHPGDVSEIEGAIKSLQDARDALVRAGAKRAAAKVRRSLKSAEGALRHAQHSPLMQRVRAAVAARFPEAAAASGAAAARDQIGVLRPALL